MTRKSVTPDSFQLLVDTPQKVPPAFGNIPRKNVYARPLPAAFSHRSRGSPSGPMRRPEKEQLQTAFGFGSILFEKSLQRPVATTRKRATPDRLRLLVNPFRKISPVARCDDPKKCGSRQPPALDLYWAKSPVSLRKCTLAIRLGLSALDCNKSKGNGA